MCLILVAHRQSAKLPLLVLANRDEFYSRPTAPAAPWPEAPGLVAGRDLVSGGTWLGVRGARWGAVTNVREGRGRRNREHNSRSRGWLVRDFLLGAMSPQAFLSGLTPTAIDYAGYNLLVADGEELWYGSNRDAGARRLPPGLYGLSNHLLDTPWPKVEAGKQGLGALLATAPEIDRENAFALLGDTSRAPDDALPDTGIPLHWEQALSAIFVRMPSYGTRSAALLTHRTGEGVRLVERRFDQNPDEFSQSDFAWDLSGKLLDRGQLLNEHEALRWR